MDITQAKRFLTNAIKDTVSVLYWYEELSSLDWQFLEVDLTILLFLFFSFLFVCLEPWSALVGVEPRSTRPVHKTSENPKTVVKRLSFAQTRRRQGLIRWHGALWKDLEKRFSNTYRFTAI